MVLPGIVPSKDLDSNKQCSSSPAAFFRSIEDETHHLSLRFIIALVTGLSSGPSPSTCSLGKPQCNSHGVDRRKHWDKHRDCTAMLDGPDIIQKQGGFKEPFEVMVQVSCEISMEKISCVTRPVQESLDPKDRAFYSKTYQTCC